MEPVVGSRLFTRLSEFIFRCKKNDVDYNVAMVLLDKVKDFPDVNITEVAYLSNTTPASVSRFCKKIGYPSFFDLKNDAGQRYLNPLLERFPDDGSAQAQKNNFLNHSAEIDQVIIDNIDSQQLEAIAQKFEHIQKAAVVSNIYSFSSANLFRELLSQRGINVVTINRDASEDVLDDVLKSYDIVFFINLTLDWVIEHKELIDRHASSAKVLLTYAANQEGLPTFDTVVSFSQFDFIFSSVYYSQRIMIIWVTLLGMLIQDK